ncbi:glycoside hydrolase family 25 protein [Corynebacterium mendelii]|uniref:Glycoside hydrolase family 25 protein n=1 Tax=Corynebacterium mendelii TaxID=2765362 RepID=A0A939E2E0_9CORY|nr:glycoside hydrolase family 25 protein [Corynebacterium mendelii]MBN9644431.1 glycoside hydrolase family 25 protein [Corynebacterium mendelii]
MEFPRTTTAIPLHRRRIPAIAVASILTVLAVVAGLLVVTADADEKLYPTGPDVASWQHVDGAAINWSSVKYAGHDFAFVKSTEGIGYVNPYFIVDSKQAAKNGMLVGSYHYARPAQDARMQAREYAASLVAQPQPSLPPVLDLEVSEGLTPSQLVDWTDTFLREIETLTGRQPMIYTYRYFWNVEMGNTTAFTDYPLWLAAYQDTAPTDIPGGWDFMTFWQQSDHATISGIPGATDYNIFNGTRGQLNDLVAGNNLSLGTIIEGNISSDRLVGTAMELKTFGENNRELVGAILAVAAGVIGIGALLTFARSQGLDLGPANQLVDYVQHLIASGNLPIDDLKTMAAEGDYSVGDLLILLKNAEKLSHEIKRAQGEAG